MGQFNSPVNFPFDAQQFTQELSSAIIAALSRQHGEFDGEVVTCLALDIHPYDGFLNLCMRTDEDASDWHADWKHSCFAAAYGEENWPEGLEVACKMEELAESAFNDPEKNDTEAALPFLICAVLAFRDPRIGEELQRLKLSDKFEFYVGEPQNPNSKNYCHVYQES